MVYCVFTGLGKTYFCQHNLGWHEIDEETYLKYNTLYMWEDLVNNYAKYGYNIITSISPVSLTFIKIYFPDATLVLPEDSAEAKAFILNNIKTRAYDPKYYEYISERYDAFYSAVKSLAKNFKNVIYVPAGKYLSDIIAK